MPDANKLQVLRDAGFKIREVCGGCSHYRTNQWSREWGGCAKAQYRHQKHSGDERDVSVPFNGWCPSYSEDAVALSDVTFGFYREFFEK